MMINNNKKQLLFLILSDSLIFFSVYFCMKQIVDRKNPKQGRALF